MKRTNPYSPGLAARPPLLAGREHWQAVVDETFAAAESGRRAVQPLVFHGIRGVGKTALLTALRDQARQRGWAAERLEASPTASLAMTLANRAPALLDALPGSRGRRAHAVRARLRSVSLGLAGLSAGLSFDAPSPAAVAQLHDLVRDLLVDLGSTARQHDLGVAVMIDELQDAPVADLRAVAAAIQATAEDALPVVLVGAGLPGTQQHLMDAVTYAERIRFAELTGLAPEATVAALVEPARDQGVTWEAEALDMIVVRSEGYPYLVQLYGQHTWEAGGGGDRLTAAHVTTADAAVWEALDQGAYGHRWAQLRDSEQEYLLAMALEGDSPSSSAIATRLGRSTSALSVVRGRLIERGLITAPRRDQLRFVFPAFARYTRARSQQDGRTLG
ncbi:MAG: ATP-binding protein [Acidimicrobiales bacterium]